MKSAPKWVAALGTRLARGAGLCALLASVGCSSGAAGAGSCKKITACGGDPTGTWTLVDSCMVPSARTASNDWCSGLVYDAKNGVRDGLFLGHEFLPVTSATVTYKDDNSYEALFGFGGETTTYFPRACLKQHGVKNPSCSELADSIHALAMNVLPAIQDLVCLDTTDGGCACTYSVHVEAAGAQPVADVGIWRIKGTILNHYPSTTTPAYPADYCVNGDELQLHGHDDTGLMGHDLLRNLTLHRQ